MYYKKFYHNLKEDHIAKLIQEEGFNPIRIVDESGYKYPLHSHPETKLLAFLKGSMVVRVSDQVYQCGPSDKVIIPGNIQHSAIVGDEGCEFFWSEKMI